MDEYITIKKSEYLELKAKAERAKKDLSDRQKAGRARWQNTSEEERKEYAKKIVSIREEKKQKRLTQQVAKEF
jgi:hypothetical protein